MLNVSTEPIGLICFTKCETSSRVYRKTAGGRKGGGAASGDGRVGKFHNFTNATKERFDVGKAKRYSCLKVSVSHWENF